MERKNLINNIKILIQKDGLYQGIINIIKIFEKWSFRNCLRFKGKFSSSVINNPFQVIYVPVNLINFRVSDPESLDKITGKRIFLSFSCLRGIILDTNWDKVTEKFTYHEIYIGFKERFIEKKDWEKTVYYSFFQKVIKGKGEAWKSFRNWDEFKVKKLNKYDKMFEFFKKNGMKSQKERNNQPEDEIQVGVSRNKEILLIQGYHRFSIAKILGIKEIPVIVHVWHKDYIDWVKQNTKYKKLTPCLAIKPILENIKK